MATTHSSGDLPLHKLHFDPKNPRLPPSVDGADDDAVLRWMLADASLLQLMDAIATQGFFPGEPLLVSPRPDLPEGDQAIPEDAADTDWVVVEGNRRLAALRLLTSTESAPLRPRAVADIRGRRAEGEDFDTVPVVKFARRQEILRFLGFRHITGIKEWDPLEKARYLRDVRREATRAGEPHANKDLARRIGSTPAYVGRLLTALEALEQLTDHAFFTETRLQEDDIPFSFLVLALNYQSIVTFLGLDRADDASLQGLDTDRLRTLARWLFVEHEDGATVLGDSRNMKVLAQVVSSEAAIADLEGGIPLRDAAMSAVAPSQLLLTALSQSVARMKVADREARRIDEAPDEALEQLAQVRFHSEQVEQALAGLRTPSTRD
ncbi:MAG: hypothetical protein JHC95_09550 [Solirubrobacteraceae bacterium]|nr:hypothetical protein [Solirubrobacteraceae bacterium]